MQQENNTWIKIIWGIMIYCVLVSWIDTPQQTTPQPCISSSYYTCPANTYNPVDYDNNYDYSDDGYMEVSETTGRLRTNYVSGYYRKDGTYVRGYYRS
jgi:hypothetical protein